MTEEEVTQAKDGLSVEPNDAMIRERVMLLRIGALDKKANPPQGWRHLNGKE